jgi:glyoxylase-like metal-dependent hydrolase (beta-lactamase superfamily II)
MSPINRMLVSFLLSPLLVLSAAACTASSHATRSAGMGVPISGAAMEALIDQPGPVEVETVVGADWAVTRAGLINLDSPAAKAAHLVDGDEPIQVYAHVIRHPTRGIYLVDTGVSRALVEDPAHLGLGWIVRKAMHPEKMVLRTDTAGLLAREGRPLSGVLLTHLHLDHISGMSDVPRGTPIFAGPGETRDRAALFLVTRGSIDALMAGQDAIRELGFTPDPSRRFAAVLDLFGDGTVFAISAPGHTPGSTAYLVRTPRGPVLLTGDASHTRWGWEHDVEPGTFSSNRSRSVASLASLRALAARHPALDVRLGHQR